ncbi:MAG: proline--tRNA ligase [Gammaproteobacteria bacterium]
MRTSQCLMATQKETPADAELISHQLMYRAGLIRKLGAGLYTWLPLGLRVLNRVSQVVREEMNQINGQEILMPAIQPATLWQETGRWETFGPQLLSMKDRNDREYCFGPTHEEVVTDLMRKELKSYKQLPLTVYQVQTKFRDEIRPRFGVMRAREFIMKDAYSFHLSTDCLQKTYDDMYRAYSNIFTRLGLKFRAVLADTGAIGGNNSHEFHVLADSGEDALVYCPTSDYAANLEKAESAPLSYEKPSSQASLELTATPGIKTIQAQAEFMKLEPKQILKTLLVKGTDAPVVALLLRGDHELNEVKAAKLNGIASPLQLASDQEIQAAVNCPPGFIGPIELNVPIFGDYAIEHMYNFSCGANQKDKHYIGVNWGRDVTLPTLVDLRNVQAGDPSPDGKGSLEICRGIEVGHIFQLGNKYSEAMKATVLTESGAPQVLEMGCYGIGISRIVAAAIEQNHDERGIIWPDALAPYQVVIIPMGYDRSPEVKRVTDEIYQKLLDMGVEVLLDDRNERPGVLFADMDLIGIPHRIVVGERGLKEGKLEYKHRRAPEATMMEQAKILPLISKLS